MPANWVAVPASIISPSSPVICVRKNLCFITLVDALKVSTFCICSIWSRNLLDVFMCSGAARFYPHRDLLNHWIRPDNAAATASSGVR